MSVTIYESAIELKSTSSSNVVVAEVSGKLETSDYELLAPAIEEAIKKHGKIRLLFTMKDFHGWTAGALWEDVKFDAKHFKDLERLAMVGDKAWERGMALFCKPFTTAKIKYFDASELDVAREWIKA